MPMAIREASLQYGFFKSHAIQSGELKMVDYGDALFHPGNVWDYLDQVEKTASEILGQGVSVFGCGGDHSVPLPLVRAYGKRIHNGLSLIHLDAHLDSYGRIYPYPTNGTWINELTDEGWVNGKRSVSLGIRPGQFFGTTDTVHVLESETMLDNGPEWTARRILEIVGDNLTYITIDPDFLNVSEVPAVEVPEPFGPDMRYAKKLFAALMGKGLKVIGFDISELAPQCEPPLGMTAMNLCYMSNWCLDLLVEGRKAAGLARR